MGAPSEVCEKRDRKGLYKLARQGKIERTNKLCFLIIIDLFLF